MMRRWLLMSVAWLSALLAPGHAGGQIPGSGGSSEDTFRKQAEASFKVHDQNQDGYLDGYEIPEDLRTILASNNASPKTQVRFQDYLQYKEVAYQLQTAISFKSRDRNQDGHLDKYEMPVDLRSNLAKYSRRPDGPVSFEEYLRFRRDRDFPPRPDVPAPEAPAPKRTVMPPQIITIDEAALEKRPAVYRAGKLPKGLPAWFDQLDMDQDGQIALFEWRQGRKAIAEFSSWDRNDDGLITIEEVMYKLDQERLAAKRTGKGFAVGAGKEFRDGMADGAATEYLIRFEKGKTYAIDMIASNTQMLDPFLYLMDQQGKLLARDDDSGGQLNARIVFKPDATANYRIIAASVGNRGNGEYVLSVQEKMERASSPSTGRSMPQ